MTCVQHFMVPNLAVEGSPGGRRAPPMPAELGSPRKRDWLTSSSWAVPCLGSAAREALWSETPPHWKTAGDLTLSLPFGPENPRPYWDTRWLGEMAKDLSPDPVPGSESLIVPMSLEVPSSWPTKLLWPLRQHQWEPQGHPQWHPQWHQIN